MGSVSQVVTVGHPHLLQGLDRSDAGVVDDANDDDVLAGADDGGLVHDVGHLEAAG